MDLISLIIGLPFAPVRGVLAVASVLQDEAERQLYDPSQVRRSLEEIEAARAEGRISDDDARKEEQQTVDRLLRR